MGVHFLGRLHNFRWYTIGQECHYASNNFVRFMSSSSSGGSSGISWRPRSNSKPSEGSNNNSPTNIADDQRMNDELESPCGATRGRSEAYDAASAGVDTVKASDQQPGSISGPTISKNAESVTSTRQISPLLACLQSCPKASSRRDSNFSASNMPLAQSSTNPNVSFMPANALPDPPSAEISTQGLSHGDDVAGEAEATVLRRVTESQWWGSPRLSQGGDCPAADLGFVTPREAISQASSFAEYNFEMAARNRQISVSPYSFGPGPVNMDESDNESPFLSACSSAESPTAWFDTPITSSDSDTDYHSPSQSSEGDAASALGQAGLIVDHLPWRGKVKPLDKASDLYQRRWSEGCVCQ